MMNTTLRTVLNLLNRTTNGTFVPTFTIGGVDFFSVGPSQDDVLYYLGCDAEGRTMQCYLHPDFAGEEGELAEWVSSPVFLGSDGEFIAVRRVVELLMDTAADEAYRRGYDAARREC